MRSDWALLSLESFADALLTLKLAIICSFSHLTGLKNSSTLNKQTTLGLFLWIMMRKNPSLLSSMT
ncbi:hypothetical protein BpHYR1_021708 [Brachionus plicatilis]|uniref:Uncharacterized protein n=1 Tax=Brachionus plicatilis TaxID=10195 RepID=A0A3M7T680_BRAPC|nr:hypothetical protein BpHYR1_021708 [Brachionus plicatilis]